MKQGLVLDKVVLLGRTLDEYARYFALDLDALAGAEILDVASGVSSFTAEANARGLRVTAFDCIYELEPAVIQSRCEPDLERVIKSIEGLNTYRWEFYKNLENLRALRERAYKTFLADYAPQRGARYVAGSLPSLPFGNGQFDLTVTFGSETDLLYKASGKDELAVRRFLQHHARRQLNVKRMLSDFITAQCRFPSQGGTHVSDRTKR